jgi:predicted nucleic acid-binding protein
MCVLVDTNVVLDTLLARAPWHVEADEMMRRSRPGVLELAVSALTIANLFYVGRKLVGAVRAREDVRKCLAAFETVPIDRSILLDADALPGKDFEDNLQIAAAGAAGLDMIVTRDVKHFEGSPIRVVNAVAALDAAATPATLRTFSCLGGRHPGDLRAAGPL